MYQKDLTEKSFNVFELNIYRANNYFFVFSPWWVSNCHSWLSFIKYKCDLCQYDVCQWQCVICGSWLAHFSLLIDVDRDSGFWYAHCIFTELRSSWGSINISNHRHVFRTYCPHQCGDEFHVGRKILSVMWGSNPGPTNLHCTKEIFDRYETLHHTVDQLVPNTCLCFETF